MNSPLKVTQRKLVLSGLDAMLWLPQRHVALSPLVMVSHGAGGSRIDHRGTATALAKNGFIVCAIEHRGDNWRDKKLLGTRAYWATRPRQFSDALEDLLTSTEFSGCIDLGRIGALGFSAGGYTVLAAAVGRPDYEALSYHMSQPARDPRFCGYARDDHSSMPPSPDLSQLFSVRNLRAVLTVAPVGVPFGPNSLSEMKIPTRIYRAEADQILAHPFHAESIHNYLPIAHEYRVIENLHHFGFIEPFPPLLRLFGFEAAKDPKGFDRRAFLTRFNPEIVEFFQTTI